MTPMLARLYRVLVRVPNEYISAIRRQYGPEGQKQLLLDVRNRFMNMGFLQTLLATQDPTDNRLLTVLARVGEGLGQTLIRDPIVKILSMEHVEEPPKAAPAGIAGVFDPGMTDDEAATVQKAILYDRNARHLGGLASTLEPSFPGAASMLRAKADLIEKRVWMNEDASRKLLEHGLRQPLPQQRERIFQARGAFEDMVSRSPLPGVLLRDNVRNAIIGALENDTSLLSAHAPAVRELAKTVVTDPVEFCPDRMVTYHLRLVYPASVRLALPPQRDDTFVSPSALQLILATQKPEWSKVTNQSAIPDVIGQIERRARAQGKPMTDVLKAKNQIARAQKAIDRRRWIEWYRRQPGHHVQTL